MTNRTDMMTDRQQRQWDPRRNEPWQPGDRVVVADLNPPVYYGRDLSGEELVVISQVSFSHATANGGGFDVWCRDYNGGKVIVRNYNLDRAD